MLYVSINLIILIFEDFDPFQNIRQIDYLCFIFRFHERFTFLSIFRLFDTYERKKVDLNELQHVRPESHILREMQHSKWATSNNLFDYNAFINDFYGLLEEYREYKNRTSETSTVSSPEKLPEILSSLKGSFYFNGDNVISHQYSMVMTKPSRVKIALEVSSLYTSTLIDAGVMFYSCMYHLNNSLQKEIQ